MRHKQQPIGNFRTRDVVHGYPRYKKFGCRCEVCRAAMSAYGKERYEATKGTGSAAIARPEPSTGPSWWLGQPAQGFTATVERDHAGRMKGSRFGKFPSRPYTTDELGR